MVVDGTKAIVDVDVDTRIEIIVNEGVVDVVGVIIVAVDVDFGDVIDVVGVIVVVVDKTISNLKGTGVVVVKGGLP